MLALCSADEHSGRSLTTTYETNTYLLHYSPHRRWLVDVVRQQERVHDDNQHDVQLNRGDHEEGYGREENDDHEEAATTTKKTSTKKKSDSGASPITDAGWLERGFAAISC